MKKKRIPAVLRIILMLVLIASTITLSFVTFWTWKNPGTVEEKISLYTYSQSAMVDYQVDYRSNILTGTATVGKGETYITEYLNNILTTFDYEFKGERVAEYQGRYDVKATLIGYRLEQNERVPIWRKEYELVPETTFEGNDASILLTKELPINLRQYNDFTEKFSKETKISCETNLIVNWNVAIEAITDQGLIKETLTPTLIIPIDKSYFNISGEPTQEKSGVIEKVITKTLPVKTKNIALLGVSIVLLLALLALVIFFTEGSRITDPLELKKREIFKKHGERLIALGDDPPGETTNPITVLSIEDLIKIADELCKPVFYKADPTRETAPTFFVFAEPKVYIYQLVIEHDESTSEQVSIKADILMSRGEEI